MKRHFRKTLAVLAMAAAVAAAHASELVYVGTQANQIHALRFDPDSGKLATIGKAASDGAPTWTLAHPRLPVLYAVDNNREKEGRVISYAIDKATGALALTGAAPSGGSGATYLSLDAAATTAFVANYGGGSVSSVALKADGGVERTVSTVKTSGTGPSPRQASPHAHSIRPDPSGRYALVPDLGADKVFVFPFDRATRALAPDDAGASLSLAVPAGSGPRHFAFGRDGRFAYVLNELKAEIMVLRWDARQGRLAPAQSVSLSGAEFTGVKSGSEILVSKDGRFVYAANRGENTLQVYRVEEATGTLSLAQRMPCGGELPWGFAIHPSGKWLLAANQRSNTVNLFGIDTATGQLKDSGQSLDVPSPTNISFVP